MAKLTGGGIQSNKNVRPNVRVGPPRSNKVSVAATDAMGESLAYKRPDLYKGTMPQVPSGNAVAASTVCGPGGSRTVYKTGYQNTYGTPSRGEGQMEGKADRGSRAILGEKGSKQP
jgi:hypothetical protein